MQSSVLFLDDPVQASSHFFLFFSPTHSVASFWKEIQTQFTIRKFVLILKQEVSVTSFSQEMQLVQ